MTFQGAYEPCKRSVGVRRKNTPPPRKKKKIQNGIYSLYKGEIYIPLVTYPVNCQIKWEKFVQYGAFWCNEKI